MTSRVRLGRRGAIDAESRPERFVWALAVIVAVQLYMFLFAATRGLDLTDESFYFLSFRYWTQVPAASLFGAYLGPLFSLVGHNVWAIRAIGFVVLLGAGVWFGFQVCAAFDALAGRATREGLATTAIASSAAIWNYYGAFVVPYTPSYNWLTLVGALATLALALRIGRSLFASESRGEHRNALALGVFASIGIASKFSAGLLVLGLCMFILCTFGWRRIGLAAATRIALAVGVGLLVNLVVLGIVDANLFVRFRRGMEVSLAMLPRNPIAELGTFIASDLPREAAVAARILLWPVVFALVAFAVGFSTKRRTLFDAIAVTGFVIGAMLDTYVKDNRSHRILLLTIVTVVLVLSGRWMARRSIDAGADAGGGRAILVGAAIVAVPFTYSFGTNNPLLWHMGMAAIFPAALATAQIRASRIERLIPGWAFVVSLAVVAALPAEIVVRQWLNGQYTYRLGAALVDQATPMPPNPAGIDLRVNPGLAIGLRAFLDLMRRSGFVAGDSMIDFTGQAPGLVAVCGAAPLGALWIVGGTPFDGEAASRVALGYVSKPELRRAWLLTSSDSFARIDAWPQLLEARLGTNLSHEEAGRVTLPDPTSGDKTKMIEISLWRPRR